MMKSNSRANSRLFILCGPTAVGKGTVVGSLRDRYPGKFYLSISSTTRKPRPGEVEGRTYFFVSREKFKELIDSGGMLEWAEVHHQNFYGTPAKPVDEALSKGLPVLLEIDLAGFRQVKALRPEAHSIFLLPPSWDELVLRLTGRGTETPEEQQRRLETAKVELAAQKEFDEIVVNDKLENTVAALAKIMGIA